MLRLSGPLVLVTLLLVSPAFAALDRCPGYALNGARAGTVAYEIVGAADLDGDGALDLVTASSVLFGISAEVKLPLPVGTQAVAAIARLSHGGQLGLLRIVNRSLQSIRFAAGRTMTIGSTPLPVDTAILAVGDVNGDGIDDVVLRENIFFGNGDGTFTAGPPLPVLIRPSSNVTVTVGDFNGDHFLDLAIRLDDGGIVTIYSGDGMGTFRAGAQAPAPLYGSILAADLDGDGRDDLVIGALHEIDVVPSSSGVMLRLSTDVAGTSGLTIGDFNGDGWPDIAAFVQPSDTASELRVWLNDGRGGMTLAWRTPMVGGFRSTQAVDVDHDGKDDLITTAYESNEVAVLHSNGDGTFAGLPPAGAIAAEFGVSADLDGDGDDDVILTNATQSIVLWNDAGTFRRVNLSQTLPTALLAADVDGDGKAEILARDPLGVVSVLKIAPDGTVTKVLEVRGDPNAYGYVTGMAVGRFTGSALEVALVYAAGPRNAAKIEVIDLRAPTVPRFTALLPPSLTYDVVASDVNGDGRDDLIVVGEGIPISLPHHYLPEVNGWVVLLLSTGASFEPAASVYQSGFSLKGPVAGDFNGDGVGDVAFFGNTAFYDPSIVVLYGDRDRQFHSQELPVRLGLDPSLRVADLDGDGTSDIVAANGGTIGLLFGSASGINRRALYLGQGSTNAALIARSRPGGVPSIIALDSYADGLLLRPSCDRVRAARH